MRKIVVKINVECHCIQKWEKKQWGRSMIKENAYKEGEQEKTSCCRCFANEH